MPHAKEPVNPFYVLVVVVGVAFLITAIAFGAMAWLATQPAPAAPQRDPATGRLVHPLLDFLDRRGIELLTWELVALGLTSAAAMGLDQRRSRRALESPRQEPAAGSRPEAGGEREIS